MLANATNSREQRAREGPARTASIRVGSSDMVPVTCRIAMAITAPTTTKNEPDRPCPRTPARYPPRSVFASLGTSAIPPTSVITNAKFASMDII